LVGVESWLLRRDACRRFLERSLLARAPILLREWFPEAAEVAARGAPSKDTETVAGSKLIPEVNPIRGKRGRKRGSGEIDDRKPLEDMLRLFAAGRTNAMRDAARQVADGATGNSLDSKLARLAGKFSKRFGAEPPDGKTWANVLETYEIELKAN
jgi:hypothetical protein